MQALEDKPSRTLDEYWAIAVRRRWWIILPLFLCWALILFAGHFIPPRFRSETVILVEQERIPEHYVVPNVAIDLQGRLQSMSQQILSRTRLGGIIEKFHLYSAEAAGGNVDGLVARMRQDIKIDLVPGRPGELSAFKISYSAPTPSLAQQVTKQLSSVFIQENLRNREQLSESTTKFLEAQLADARANLDRQDNRLREFKALYLGELPEQLQSNLQIFSGLQVRIQAAMEALHQANQQKVYLESLLAQYKTLRAQTRSPRDTSPYSPLELEERLEKLKGELADLKARYTANHPDVLRVKEQIAEAEMLKRKADAKEEMQNSDTPESLGAARTAGELRTMSPMLQVQGQLKANQVEIATRKREIEEMGQQIQQYQARLNTIPVREQQLAAITREHDQARAAYESLLAKKQQSEMATDLEKQQGGAPFHIIDPPNLPQKPYWPDRFKLSLAGLALGLCASLALTTLVELIDARINREQDLRDLVSVSVMAGIPPIKTTQEEKRERRRWYVETVAASIMATSMPLVTLMSYFRG